MQHLDYSLKYLWFHFLENHKRKMVIFPSLWILHTAVVCVISCNVATADEFTVTVNWFKRPLFNRKYILLYNQNNTAHFVYPR